MVSRLHRALFAACATMAAALALAQQAPNSSQTTAQSAAQSAQKAAADSKATASAAASASAATNAAATASAAAAQKKAADDILVRDARNAGFKPETIRGNRMFCRTATELGSSFPVRTCYDEDQVKIKIQEYQAQRNQMEAAHNLGMQVH